METKFPLQLETVTYLEQRVKALSTHKPNEPYFVDPKIQAVCSGEPDEDKRFAFVVTVKSGDSEKNAPYEYGVTVIGTFFAFVNETEEKSKRARALAAVQLLIGCIRERLSILTAQGPWGPITMDFIPFQDVEIEFPANKGSSEQPPSEEMSAKAKD